jgi:hypothetical protein
LLDDLIVWGRLERRLRRISKKRNATNIYIVIDLVSDCTEKKKLLLKTNTRAGAAIRKPEKSRFALQWESRQEQNRRDHERKRREFAERGKRWVELRRWRKKQADRHSRWEAEKHLGVDKGPKTPDDDPALVAWRVEYWKREHEREKLRKNNYTFGGLRCGRR